MLAASLFGRGRDKGRASQLKYGRLCQGKASMAAANDIACLRKLAEN